MIAFLQAIPLFWTTQLTAWAVQGALVALLCLLVTRAMPRASSQLRHAILAVALLNFLVPPWVGTWSPWSDAIPAFEVTHEKSDAENLAPRAAILGIHLAGIAFVLGRCFREARELRKLRGRASSLSSGPLHAEMLRLCDRLEVESPQLLVCPTSDAPFLTGLRRPAIVIPTVMRDQLSSSALSHILAHELIHLRQRDVWLSAVRVIACAVWFFNPLVWFVAREIARVREECCDDALVQRLEVAPRDYAHSLIAAAEFAVAPPGHILGVGIFGGGDHPLRSRITRLASPVRRDMQLASWQLALLVLVILFLIPRPQLHATAPDPASFAASTQHDATHSGRHHGAGHR